MALSDDIREIRNVQATHGESLARIEEALKPVKRTSQACEPHRTAIWARLNKLTIGLTALAILVAIIGGKVGIPWVLALF